MIDSPTHARGSFIILDGVDRGLSIRFPINPEKIDMDRSAVWSDPTIVGFSHPSSQYKSGGPRPITFTLHLDALSPLLSLTTVGVTRTAGGKKIQSNIEKLMECQRFIESLTLPRSFSQANDQNGTIFYGPPPFLFVYGPRFRIRCIMRSVKSEWLAFRSDLEPLRLKLDLEMHEQPTVSATWEKYRRKGDTTEVAI